MNQRELSEMEKVMQKTIDDLGRQIANLTVDLSLARAQILVQKENEKKESEEDA